MKRHAVGVVIFCLSATQALAQTSNSADWTGYYVGVHSGARWSRIEPDASFFSPFFSPNNGGNPTAFGAQFGHDWQYGDWTLSDLHGHWELGFEGDIDLGKHSTSTQQSTSITICRLQFPPGTPPGIGPPFPPGTRCAPTPVTTVGRTMDSLADVSARIRAGLTLGRGLIYATGGLAVQRTRIQANDSYVTKDPIDANQHCGPSDPACFVSGTDGKAILGWSLGIGAEFQVDRRLSFGLEYRHADFGRKTFNFDPTFSGNAAQFLAPPSPTDARFSDNRLTIRANYRFNGT
jgi:opacity protein-like surface antigen